MRQVGAVDIGGTKIAVGIVREDGTVQHQSACPTDPEKGVQDAVTRIHRMLSEGIERCGAIDGVGVGCPGPLDPFTGVIGDVGTLPSWKDEPLAEQLAAATGLTVAVENDADAAALAEYAWSGQAKTGTLIYVTVSTGIGGGVVQDGRLYRGVRGAHPEFGHQLLDPTGPPCYCGLSGCWESLASGPALSAWYRDAGGAAATSAVEIAERARAGESLAIRAMQHEARYLGLGLANLVTLFAPDRIALGGGVLRSSDLFLADAEAMVRRLCTQVPVEDTVIEHASVGRDIGLLGAAQVWLGRNR